MDAVCTFFAANEAPVKGALRQASLPNTGAGEQLVVWGKSFSADTRDDERQFDCSRRARRGRTDQWVALREPAKLRPTRYVRVGCDDVEAFHSRLSRPAQFGGHSRMLAQATIYSARVAAVRLAALLVVFAVVASGYATAGPPASTTTTTLHKYSPFTADSIARGIHITRAAPGYCWTNSSADRAGAAFRCFVGNVIHDPCFANFALTPVTYVVCPLYHPGSSVLRINLTRKLPQGSRTGDPNPMDYPPWAVKTTSGKWCERLTGATGSVVGLGVSYGCEGGGLLLGEPRRGTPLWSASYAGGYKATRYHRITLGSAWWL